ncbi:MAG TPA: hypothetical protein VMW73_12385, partial [Spirochaetia bacterium]|nr:hypothetical protein [Spirochaetia bacterium]
GGSSGSFVVGFFYARDNYTRTAGTGTPTDFSNQMIMFYMNSYAYSQTLSGGEMLIFSTLAHEFQHMIHFYQKTVLRAGGLGTDTWINEMMSMMTEDILADKIGTAAEATPRGVAGTTYDAGSSGNTNGRLPAFDAFDDISLSNWGAVDTLGSYAVAYSFGAYLERNYGGATLLHDMMYNSYTDARAVTQGVLAASGQSVSFATLLTRWAASVLLSTSTAPAFYQYSASGTPPFTSSYGVYSNEAYNLGSINMFNYSWGSNNGPYIYPATSTMIQPPSGSQGAYSNQYVELGPVSGPTTFTKYFTVGDNNSVTIVVK